MQHMPSAQRVNHSSDESYARKEKPHPRTVNVRKLHDSNPASWSPSSAQAAISVPAHPSPPALLSSVLHAQSLAYSLGQLSWSLPSSSAPNPSSEALGSSWQIPILILT